MKLLINTDNVPNNMDVSFSVFVNNLIKVANETNSTDDLSFTQLNGIIEKLKTAHINKY